jgi:kynurenine formamidase
MEKHRELILHLKLILFLRDNARTTQADIHASDRTSINGLQSWSARGLAGRGVLIDYASYAKRHNIDIHHFSGHAITLENVLDVIKEQGVDLFPGDVLFLRTGYVEAYKALDEAGRERVAVVREWCGLGQSRETTEWLWQKQFAAVASDSPGFEVRRKHSVYSSQIYMWFSHITDIQ